MNKEFLNQVNASLIKELQSKYNFDDAKVRTLGEAGKTSILGSLKQFVLKNGTSEIEGILLDKVKFNGSKLQTVSFANFQKDITEKKLLGAEQTNDVAAFSINHLIDRFKEGFNASGYSKDLDGICNFLEIDKKILGLVNSPVAKMFGKFF